jgi:hypothetical protein
MEEGLQREQKFTKGNNTSKIIKGFRKSIEGISLVDSRLQLALAS